MTSSPKQRLLLRQQSISLCFPVYLPRPVQSIIFEEANVVLYILRRGSTSIKSLEEENQTWPIEFSTSQHNTQGMVASDARSRRGKEEARRK